MSVDIVTHYHFHWLPLLHDTCYVGHLLFIWSIFFSFLTPIFFLLFPYFLCLCPLSVPVCAGACVWRYMCVWVHVCVCMCVRAGSHVYTSVHVCAWSHVYTRVQVHVCVCRVDMYISVGVHVEDREHLFWKFSELPKPCDDKPILNKPIKPFACNPIPCSLCS